MGSSPDRLTSALGAVFFRAATGATGVHFWIIDGTEAGTVRVPQVCLSADGCFAPDGFTLF